EFPMRTTIHYASHKVLLTYFQEFAYHFALTAPVQFQTKLSSLDPLSDGGWQLTAQKLSNEGEPTTEAPITAEYDHVILANGILAEPNIPEFKGEFTGEIMHTSLYKGADQLRGKRVLIIGAGNSGCDIAVDAVHHAVSIDMSVRRGYYFVPRY